jgi:diketogulonate reductase-like aldo/keto reductase
MISAKQMLTTGMPYLFYGTAWKKDDTASLVAKALRSGFRFIDTACQPKHYNEAGVGEGWTTAAAELGLDRSDIFLQTKFTSVGGQDPDNIPYDKEAPLEEQVKQSFQKSLENLRTDYIDSLVLHSPMETMEDTLRAWKVLESFVDEKKVGQIGISNCYNFRDLRTLHQKATIKPAVVQNRFHDQTKYDVQIREICNMYGIKYQSFWTLTAPSNRKAMESSKWKTMAKDKGLTPQTLMYGYMMSLGHTPLDGSKNSIHMKEDIELMMRFQNGEEVLDESEVKTLSLILGIEVEK